MAAVMAVLIASVPWLAPDELAPQLVQATTVSEARGWAPISDTNAADGYVEPHPYFTLSAERVAQFDRLAQCESGGRWDIDTGNGYLGGLQWLPSTWRGIGGQGSPADASREEQIWRGHLLQEQQGWRPWPACSRRLRLVD